MQKIFIVLAAAAAALFILLPAVAASDFVAKLSSLLESAIR